MIVTFTDFGILGPYLGQMKAKIIEHAPDIPLVDLMVDVPAFNIRAGATLLAAFTEQFSSGTIFLSIVDPGVGGDRKALCINCDDQWFVGPDNGLFEYVIKKSKKVTAYEITWRPKILSKSFHGRDLFAPIAAKIAMQKPFERTEINLSDLIHMPSSEDWEIIYIDSYGNCWSNIQAGEIDQSIVLSIGNTNIEHASVFCDTDIGKPFWYVNSSSLVEIAINQGNAQDILTLKIGTIIKKR
jgi:S-adenosyl-L-methionine hydrolase (adenosine-forming)